MTETQYYDLPDLPKLPAKNIPGLPTLPLNNRQWKEWEPEVLAHRITVRNETETLWSGQEKARAEQIILTAQDGRYWLSTFGAIYEANVEAESVEMDTDDWDEPGPSSGWVLPFIPYVFQLYYWDLQYKAFRTRGPQGDLVVLKSRQMGMSNTACAVYSHAWMTRKPFQGRLLSRKEDLVDESNNPDALFWKIKLQLQSQPKWLLQAFAPGFDWKTDYMLASLTNPANFNHLAGESTNATAGRGGTATGILLDEYGFMRGGRGVWTATRAATKHRTAISTPCLRYGSHLYDLVEKSGADAPLKMVVPHYLHPDHGDEWLAEERKRDTEAGIQTEVLLNFFGDESDFVYPGLGDKNVGNYPYMPYAGPVFVSIDDGFTGYWSFSVIQYVEKEGRHRIVDAYRNSRKVVDFYGSLFRSTKVDGFAYGEDEDRIIDLMRIIQNPIYVGDTHGKNVEQVAGMSVIERLATRWGIYVNVDFQKRDYKDRWQFTAEGIPFTDWNDTPGVRLMLRSCRTYKWKTREEQSEIVTEDREPVKNADSHDATQMEYYFTNFESFKNIYVVGGQIVYE